MEPRGTHCLVVFSLAIISFYSIVAGINDDEDRLRVVIGNWPANRCVLYKSFDVLKCLLLCFLPLEFDTFLRESREERRVLGEPRNEPTDIINKTEESSYFRNIMRGWPVEDLLNLGCGNAKPIWRDGVPKEFDFLCEQ